MNTDTDCRISAERLVITQARSKLLITYLIRYLPSLLTSYTIVEVPAAFVLGPLVIIDFSGEQPYRVERRLADTNNTRSFVYRSSVLSS